MRIGIIEICEKGHYMLSNALIKTYLSEPQNTVIVFTNRETGELLLDQNKVSDRLKYIFLENDSQVSEFLNSVSGYNLDRVHLATVTKYFKAFYRMKLSDKCQVYFHFHNIELWFEPAWKIQINRLKHVFANYTKEVKVVRNLKYSMKDVWWDYYRKKFIEKASKHYNLVILSEAQRFHLNKYLNALNALIFPTLIFEPDNYQDTSSDNDLIRICIPGGVTQTRREYNKLFDVIEQYSDFYKANYQFDLLGYLPPEDKNLKDRIIRLVEKGMNILYYNKFIDANEFDIQLYKCDFVLSNILLNEDSGIQSKETAAVYHMIRGAKPGIFPSGFQLDTMFAHSVLKFDNYKTIHQLFTKLVENKPQIASLKSEALKISLENSPEALLKSLRG